MGNEMSRLDCCPDLSFLWLTLYTIPDMPTSIPKGLLIFPILKDLSKADGIIFKNKGIIKGFAENGMGVDVLDYDTRGIYLAGEQIYTFSAKRFIRILQFHIIAWKTIARHVTQQDYGFVWMRMTLITPWLAGFIRRLRKGLKKGKLILEYGSYPFANELSATRRRWYRLNRGSEERAHTYADFMITYCGQEAIDGVPNIPINNGFDVSSVPVVPTKSLAAGDALRLICVSSLKKWHAYDRLIEGMHMYLKNKPIRNIHLDIVGDGPEMEKLQRLVVTYNLSDHVTFHHFRTGADLDKIYAQSHLAIGTLGFHRKGGKNDSSLKNREYFGRGLPFVLSTEDKDMPHGLPFVLYVLAGEDPVAIQDVIRFAEDIYTDYDINKNIRAYAEEHISWKSKTKVVLNYLNGLPAAPRAR